VAWSSWVKAGAGLVAERDGQLADGAFDAGETEAEVVYLLFAVAAVRLRVAEDGEDIILLA
jgi:hypothetical protein